jgi:hypothetical protein
MMTPAVPKPQTVSVSTDRQRFCRTDAQAARIAPENALVSRIITFAGLVSGEW